MELDGEDRLCLHGAARTARNDARPLANKKLVRDLVTEIAPPAERLA